MTVPPMGTGGMTGDPKAILSRAKGDAALRRLAEKIQQPVNDRGTPFAKTRVGFVSTIDYAAWTCSAYFSDLVTPVPNIPILDGVNALPDTQGVFTQVGNEYTLIGLLSRGPQVQHAYHTGADLSTPFNAAWGNVPGFSFQAEADGVYAIECVMYVRQTTSGPDVDIMFGWSWTGTGVMASALVGNDTNIVAQYNGPWTGHAITGQVTSPLNETTGLGTPDNGVPVVGMVKATYECSAPGAVQLRFAQFVSHASIAALVQRGSRMKVERIA